MEQQKSQIKPSPYLWGSLSNTSFYTPSAEVQELANQSNTEIPNRSFNVEADFNNPDGFAVQAFLNSKGYNLKKDGKIGPRTRAAIADYKARTFKKEFKTAEDFQNGDTRTIQQFLVDKGYLDKIAPNGKTNIDGIRGARTNAAIQAYLNDLASKKADSSVNPSTSNVFNKAIGIATSLISPKRSDSTTQPTIQPVNQEDLPSFEEYMYHTGMMNGKPSLFTPLKRVVQGIHAGIQYPLGLINPDRKVGLTEGGRRQMVAAAYGDGAITDTDHQRLGYMTGHSGKEFREKTSIPGYFTQLMDSPYHNIFGQSSSVKHEDGYYPYNDNYDFNNQWRGDKVIGIYDARKGTRGTGTFWDAINEFKESRAASTHLKPAMESAAAIRGVNGTYRKSAIVSNKDMENYMEEYNRFLQSPKLQRKYFKYDK